MGADYLKVVVMMVGQKDKPLAVRIQERFAEWEKAKKPSGP
jgi:hypothetical protein